MAQETFSNLKAPINITHEYLEFGNLIKLKWAPIDEAEAYVIQRYIGDAFVTIAISLKNEYIDYEVAGFSFDDLVTYTYRLASLRYSDQAADQFSFEYPVSLSYVPEIISRFSQYKSESDSDVLEVNFNKEMKVLVQDDSENLSFYKYSAINESKTNYLTPFYKYSFLTAPDKVVQIVDNNDDDLIFIKYQNSNILGLSANDLTRKISITDFFGQVTGKFDVDFKNNLLAILDSSNSSISVLKINSNITVRLGQPTILNLNKVKNILDFNLIDSKLYILDYYGRLHIYNVNADQENVTFAYTFFDDKDLIDNYDSFYKRAFMVKNLIDNAIVDFSDSIFTDGLTSFEKTNLKSYFLTKRSGSQTDPITGVVTYFSDPLKPLFKNFSIWLNDMAYSGNCDFSLIKNKIYILIDNVFNTYLTDTNFLLDRPSGIKLNALKTYLKNSPYITFYINRTLAVFPKLISYEERYLSETKIIHSELNNQLIIIGPYYYKLFDLNIYKMQNYFHTFFSSGSLKNRTILELIDPINTVFLPTDTVDERNSKALQKAWLSDGIDRFIDHYDTNKELETLSVAFEDIRFEPYLDPITFEIIDKYDFSDKYLDLYKINFSSVFDPADVDFTYTFFSGFGFNSVFNYSNSIQLNKGFYYFYGGSGYLCLKTRVRSERDSKMIEELLVEELADGFIQKITSDYFNSLNLTTRIWYTSKVSTFNEPRVFSLYETIHTFEYDSFVGLYSFLNNKKLYTKAMMKAHSDIKVRSKVDNFNNTVLLISYGTEFDSEKTIASLITFHNFYIDTYFTLNEEFSLKRAKYTDGTFSGEIKAADDPGVFFVVYTDISGQSFISVFSFFTHNFDTGSFKKIPISSPNVFFDLAYSYWTKFIRTASLGENKDFYIFNDAKNVLNQYQDIYGNQTKVVWRWERNKDVVSEDDFLAFRVSINKNKWIYLNKAVRSHSFGDELADGTHYFYLQYQNKHGVWSDNVICKYYLKTINPSIPVLTNVEKAEGDNSKPVFYWTSEPDTSYFKITYNGKIDYKTTNNFHSPDETFISYNKYENISVVVVSYDKYGNHSEDATWLFTAKAKFDKGLTIHYDKYTSNTKPYVTWRTVKDSSSVSLLYYRFDGLSWESTIESFFQPSAELTDGAHFFEIYYYDSLNNISDVKVYYFEVNTTAAGKPLLTEETKQRTKRCSFNNLYFDFVYDDSSYRMFYSFDSFKTEYEFFDFFLDLSNKNVKTGNKLISFRYYDKFGNYSEILEYPFFLQDSTSISPEFISVDQTTGSLRPTWEWTNCIDTSYNLLKLVKDSKNVFVNPSFYGSSFTPAFDLGDGCYTLLLTSVDKFGNSSDEVGFSITINTKMPLKPVLSSKFSRNNFYSFQFVASKDDSDFYFKILSLEEVSKYNNDLFMKLDERNGITLELKENSNYIAICKAYGKNSVWSEELRISFCTPASSFSEESFKIIKDDVEYNCFYSSLDGSYKIEPASSSYKIKINNSKLDSSHNIKDNVLELELLFNDGGVLVEQKD